MEKTALEALVGQVADEFTARLNCGEQPDVEEYAQLYPEAASLLREILPTLEVLHPDEADLELDGDSVSALDLLKGCLGDFRIIREIGRGGMGIVYEAEQISLVRRVALKVLPFAAALDEKRLQRFKHEAQAAAHLHHTNIVPVFAIGCERAVHFYAMQYIAGQSLAAVIRELRQFSGRESPREGAPPEAISQVSSGMVSGRWAGSEHHVIPTPSAPTEPAAETLPQWRDTLTKEHSGSSPLFFRTIARLAIEASEALEYAHNRGVVHRDIKPANLLVDVRGDLWVTDFGMAQFRSDAELTQSGDLLGTLRYMSPEQASGKRGSVDNRTDIYSLGVSLYELSTLEPAFKGQHREELLRQITSEEPAQPRTLNRSMPRELETIILKAIAKTADERYGSARELANDLRRFLEDRPILAKRPSLLERVAKWSRRHKTVVRALGGGLFIAVIALAVSTAMVWQAKRRTEEALQAERQQRQRAEARKQLAWRAVDDMYTRVAEKWLRSQPGMTQVQREFLEKALAFYEELARENRTDPRVRYETFKAYFRVGSIHLRLGRPGPSLRAYEQALALVQQLVEEAPDDRDYRLDLYRTHWVRGSALSGIGRIQEAEEAYWHALQLIEKLAKDFPDDPRYRDSVANMGYNLGALLTNRGKYPEAERVLRAALAVADKLVLEVPDELTYPRNQALNLAALGKVLKAVGRSRAAEEAYRRALPIGAKLVADYPQERTYQQELANYQVELAWLLLAARKLAESETLLDQALRIREKLANDHPDEPEYQAALPEVYRLREQLHRAAGP